MFIEWHISNAQFVDRLGDPYHLSLIILYRHAQDTVGFVAGLDVNLLVEARVLK